MGKVSFFFLQPSATLEGLVIDNGDSRYSDRRMGKVMYGTVVCKAEKAVMITRRNEARRVRVQQRLNIFVIVSCK